MKIITKLVLFFTVCFSLNTVNIMAAETATTEVTDEFEVTADDSDKYEMTIKNDFLDRKPNELLRNFWVPHNLTIEIRYGGILIADIAGYINFEVNRSYYAFVNDYEDPYVSYQYDFGHDLTVSRATTSSDSSGNAYYKFTVKVRKLSSLSSKTWNDTIKCDKYGSLSASSN